MIDYTKPMELADGRSAHFDRIDTDGDIIVRIPGDISSGRCFLPNGKHRYGELPDLRTVGEPAPRKLTGGSSDYYKLPVTAPTSGGPAYTAECNDIIEALGMNYAEGNALKALWRIAAARMDNGKPGTTALYDSEKVVFFGQRLVAQNTPSDAPIAA